MVVWWSVMVVRGGFVKDPVIVTLLGNNSGRNLGDAAILSSLLEGFRDYVPDAIVFNPTMNPQWFIENYSRVYPKCVPLDVSPKTLSVRLFGIPTIRCLAKSKLAIICDGIIFGYKLFSPHNFLSTLYALLPFIPKKCALVLFCGGIGPFPSGLSKFFARKVLNRCKLIIMRDEDSAELAKSIGVTQPIEVVGDSAYLNRIADDDTANEILKKLGISIENKRFVGFNVTPYIDSWLGEDSKLSNRESFLEKLAAQVSAVLSSVDNNLVPLVFSCSPMDESFSNTFSDLIGAKVINNTEYLSHDIQSVMRKCEILFGMRYHSLVLSSSAGTPVVGLVYAPKVKGLMSILNTPDCAIPLTAVENGEFGDHMKRCFDNRNSIIASQQLQVSIMKQETRKRFVKMCDTYLGK